MTLLIVSFLAGVLTVMAPCVLPLLPVIVGGSIAGSNKKSLRQPLIVAASLAVSVVIFTLLLKASTSLLGVPTAVWTTLSGILVLGLGLTLVLPSLWEKVAVRLSLRSNRMLNSSFQQTGTRRHVFTGIALGPVFSSCSPTYALIVATVIPQSFALGTLYLIAYAIGLAGALLLIALLGRPLASRLTKVSNPNGLFMRGVGVLFLVVGLAVIFGLDRDFQAYVLERGWYDPILNFEQSLPH